MFLPLAEPLGAGTGHNFEGNQKQSEAIRQGSEVHGLHLEPSSVVPVLLEPSDDPLLVAHVLALVLRGHLLQILEDDLFGADGLDGLGDGGESQAGGTFALLHACDVRSTPLH